MPNNQYLKKTTITKVVNEKFKQIEDTVIDEVRMSIFLNDKKIISMMCIANDLDAHAVGFLLSENIIMSIDDISKIEIKNKGLDVYIDATINEKSLQNLYNEKTLTSGCSASVTGMIQNEIEIPYNNVLMLVKPSDLLNELKEFYEGSELYNLTGSVHKVMLYLEDKNRVMAEDIGSHNAIDKVTGKCMLQKLNTQKSILFVSGRLSSEMVLKAVMHKIPIVVSRTAATYLGIQIAKTYGITLIGFARTNKMNIYTHPQRIIEDTL